MRSSRRRSRIGSGDATSKGREIGVGCVRCPLISWDVAVEGIVFAALPVWVRCWVRDEVALRPR